MAAHRDTIEVAGWKLIGDRIMPDGTPAPFVLMLNKAAGNRFVYGELARLLAERGIGSLRVDLRAHGQSTNLGTFVPGDRSGLLDGGDGDEDVPHLMRYIRSLPNVDTARIAIVAGSYSAELAARAGREHGFTAAYVMLSPGNFSDSSFAAIRGSGAHWLMARSPNERFVREWLDEQAAAAGAETWISNANAAHATDILAADRTAALRLADWMTARLRAREDTHLEAARAIGRRLRALAFDSLGARAWPADELEPRRVGYGLGDGVAGQILFLLALHEFDPAGGWLHDAMRGGDFILAALPVSLPDSAGWQRPSGLYGGVAGDGVALLWLFRTTGQPRYADGIRRIVALLADDADMNGGAAHWRETYDILNGAAGTLLFLLDADARMQPFDARELAIAAGQGLIQRAERVPAGLRWKSSRDARFELPNFSHGTAGIAFALARLHRVSGDSTFARAAIDGARYLQSVADTTGQGFQLFYGWPDPDWAQPWDLGWAHGPAGTARLFDELHAMTGDSTWLDLRARAMNVVRSSGAPGRLAPRYRIETLSPETRFGLAGMIPFLLDRPATHDLAGSYLSTLMQDATRDGETLFWQSTRRAFMERGGEPARFTGYFYGSAGYGLALLRLHASQAGVPWPFRLPDEPEIRE